MATRDQIRRRLAGGGDAEQTFRQIAGDPAARCLLEAVGIDISTIDRQLDDADHILDVTAQSIDLLASRGWATSSSISISAHHGALEQLALGEGDKADAVIAASWAASAEMLASRVGTLAFGDPDLALTFAGRARLVTRGVDHHTAQRWDASIPILLAQCEGIILDLTVSARNRRGLFLFSRDPSRQADVVDDQTIAGIDGSLSAVRDWFSAPFDSTTPAREMSRHGIMHGRQLDYDTEANSARCIALLYAVIDWARPVASALAADRRAARYALHAGSSGVDEHGARLDRRGFTETRHRLRMLRIGQYWYRERHARYGTLAELAADDVARTHVVEPEAIHLTVSDHGWWAWSRSEAGWVFAIGVRTDQARVSYWDGGKEPGGDPLGGGWRTAETGNWSGDVCW